MPISISDGFELVGNAIRELLDRLLSGSSHDSLSLLLCPMGFGKTRQTTEQLIDRIVIANDLVSQYDELCERDRLGILERKDRPEPLQVIIAAPTHKNCETVFRDAEKKNQALIDAGLKPVKICLYKAPTTTKKEVEENRKSNVDYLCRYQDEMRACVKHNQDPTLRLCRGGRPSLNDDSIDDKEFPIPPCAFLSECPIGKLVLDYDFGETYDLIILPFENITRPPKNIRLRKYRIIVIDEQIIEQLQSDPIRVPGDALRLNLPCLYGRLQDAVNNGLKTGLYKEPPLSERYENSQPVRPDALDEFAYADWGLDVKDLHDVTRPETVEEAAKRDYVEYIENTRFLYSEVRPHTLSEIVKERAALVERASEVLQRRARISVGQTHVAISGTHDGTLSGFTGSAIRSLLHVAGHFERYLESLTREPCFSGDDGDDVLDTQIKFVIAPNGLIKRIDFTPRKRINDKWTTILGDPHPDDVELFRRAATRATEYLHALENPEPLKGEILAPIVETPSVDFAEMREQLKNHIKSQRDKLRPVKIVPMVLLSATPGPRFLWKHLFSAETTYSVGVVSFPDDPMHFEVVNAKVRKGIPIDVIEPIRDWAPPFVKGIWIYDRYFRVPEGSENFEISPSLFSKTQLRRWIAELPSTIEALIHESRHCGYIGDVGLITHKEFLEKIKHKLPRDIITGTYGNVRGTNDFEKCRIMIVIGDYTPPRHVITSAFEYITGRSINAYERPSNYRMSHDLESFLRERRYIRQVDSADIYSPLPYQPGAWQQMNVEVPTQNGSFDVAIDTPAHSRLAEFAHYMTSDATLQDTYGRIRAHARTSKTSAIFIKLGNLPLPYMDYPVKADIFFGLESLRVHGFQTSVNTNGVVLRGDRDLYQERRDDMAERARIRTRVKLLKEFGTVDEKKVEKAATAAANRANARPYVDPHENIDERFGSLPYSLVRWRRKSASFGNEWDTTKVANRMGNARTFMLAKFENVAKTEGSPWFGAEIEFDEDFWQAQNLRRNIQTVLDTLEPGASITIETIWNAVYPDREYDKDDAVFRRMSGDELGARQFTMRRVGRDKVQTYFKP